MATTRYFKKIQTSVTVYEAQGGDTTKYDLYNLTPQVNYSVFILANTTSGLSHQSAPAFFMLDPVGDQNTGADGFNI